MSAEQNKTIARRVVEEWYNQGNSAVADELYASDYIHHDPALPLELQRGLTAYKQVIGMFRAAFPDFYMTLDDVIAEGDKVVGRWTFRGTHQGELMGIPATGKQVTLTGIAISRIADDKVVEGWVNFDAMGMMQQLGVIPLSGQA